MHHRHHGEIKGSYHFKNSGDLVLVFNADNYLMAEYSRRTGRVSWQRIVLATQREAVEKWLQANHPAKSAQLLAPKTGQSQNSASRKA